MIKKITTNIYLLLFLNGLFISTLYFFRAEDLYERDLFNAIVYNIKDSLKTENKDSFLVHSVKMTHELLHERQSIFQNAQIATVTTNNYFQSVRKDLMVANGACGSNAKVLARILKANGCKVRIGQMMANNRFGAHIVVETKINNKWIVVDPLYNLYFKNPNGSLASFKDVQKNWVYFKNQTPPNYDSAYRYEGIRYTNWNKIPVILPFIKKVLDRTIGKEKADEISLRPTILRIHHILFVTGSVLYILLTSFTFWLIYQKRKVLPNGSKN